MNDVIFAFMLTLIAGLATGIGGIVALISRSTNKKFLSICLSFSAGVMIYISFAEIFLEAFEALEEAFGKESGYLIVTVAFFAGIAIMAIIDRLIPHDESHTDMLEGISVEEQAKLKEKGDLKRTGISSTIAIAIHNFPEGLITFVAALYDPAMGVAVAIAITIHNIPEGIAVAAPIYHATGSRIKALLASIGAGLSEPLGALFAWLLLRSVFEEVDGGVVGIIFAVVGGIMVFVAIHHLLPTAQKYEQNHVVMRWLFAGMAVMAISLVVLEFVL
jgi:ZIP family zinc transporter